MTSASVIDPICDAYAAWIADSGREPRGEDLAAWCHLARRFAPRPVTIAELNRAGRKTWGSYWYELADPPPSTMEPF
jgi:hypothetical protein